VTNEELGCAAQHQIERLSRTRTEAFTSNRHHYVCVLSYETHYPLETGNYACRAFYCEPNNLALIPHRLFFQLSLIYQRGTAKNYSTILMNIIIAISRDPNAMDPK
jgi:hypothetical protein